VIFKNTTNYTEVKGLKIHVSNGEEFYVGIID